MKTNTTTMSIDERLHVSNLFMSMISAADLLENGDLTDAERHQIRDIQKCNFREADDMGISYTVQNAALSAGTHNKMQQYTSRLAEELMEKYADRLTAEARYAWKEYREVIWAEKAGVW
jgi:uridylate kinase